MCSPSVSVDGIDFSIAKVSAHLSGRAPAKRRELRVFVPLAWMDFVFDPHAQRNSSVSWEHYIESLVDEFGNFVLTAYLDRICDACGVEKGKGSDWIICELRTVEAVADGVELVCTACRVHGDAPTALDFE